MRLCAVLTRSLGVSRQGQQSIGCASPVDAGNGKLGPWGRLNSHASGRRSGDQFCVYVHDRLVLPMLHNRFHELADGSLKLDHATRDYIRGQLGFRWIEMISGAEAERVERQIRKEPLVSVCLS